MTSSSLLISVLWHACLTLTSTGSAAPCPAEPDSSSFSRTYSPLAFTPTGERRYTPSDFPLAVYHVGKPPADLTQADVNRAITLALDAWNDVPCASALMSYEGHVETPEDVPVDEAILITHRTETESPCLKAGEVSRIAAAPCFVGERNFKAAVFNRDRMRWYAIEETGQVRHWEEPELPWIDFRAALTHEVGHLLGLNHPSDDVHTPRASMFASYRIDGGQARLAATDRAHLCALYPSEQVGTKTCSEDAGCAHTLDDPGARCVALDVWQVCDKRRGLLGHYCADNSLHCEDLCLITSPETRTGYCTTRCEDDEACGEGWVCDPEGLAASDASERAICVPAPFEEAPRGCQQVVMPDTKHAPILAWVCLCAGLFWARRRRLRRP